MLPKAASHAKWICLIAVLLTLYILVTQNRSPWTGRELPNPLASARQSTAISYQASESAQNAGQTKASRSAEVTKAAAEQISSDKLIKHRAEMYTVVPNLEKDLTQYKAVEVVATGYYAGEESTGKNPGHPEYGITFSGMKVQRNKNALSTIAADPAVFPIGTVLYIPGYGYGVVADTGSAIKGKRIDLYFETKDQVYQEWGKKTLNVFVVKKGAGKITEVMWNQLKNEILF